MGGGPVGGSPGGRAQAGSRKRRAFRAGQAERAPRRPPPGRPANSNDHDSLSPAEVLKDSEEGFALALRGMNEGVWDLDPRSGALKLSARLLDILGFESGGRRTSLAQWLSLIHPDDRLVLRQALRDHLNGLRPHFECEYRVRDHGGGFRWVTVRGLAMCDDEGRPVRMIGSLGDISDRKRREEELRASEACFRSLVEAAPSVIVVVGGDGLVEAFNREAERIIGIAATAAIGRDWGEVVGRGGLGAEGAHFGQWLEAARAGLVIRDQETVVGPFIVSWTLAPQGDGGGVVVVGQDITRRITAETELRRANDMLEYRVAARTHEAEAARRDAEAASRYKSQFLANMSHELRTPLNAIIGFSDTMRLEVMGAVGNPHYVDYVMAIWESGRHLLSIINDLLDLSKVEAGRFELACEWVDLADLAGAVARLLAERAAQGRVALSVQQGGSPGPVWIDPLRMRQVLFNVIGNAVKFTPAGGTVHVSLGRDGAGIWLRVADTGPGMTDDEVIRAMEPFVQIDSLVRSPDAGSGLGLPLAKRFVELHGGRLLISSAPGMGTTVTIRLSLAAPGC